MKKSELASLTVAELKALARKKKVSIPSGAKKADIVSLIASAGSAASKRSGRMSAGRAEQKAPKAPVKKTAAKKSGAAGKRTGRKKTGAASAAEQPLLRREWQMPPGAEEPLMAQERVSDAKYYTGLAERAPLPHYDTLPHEYGREQMVLMARDPSLAFGYWELPQSRVEKEQAWFGRDSKLCVRLYDVTGSAAGAAAPFVDQLVPDRVGTWYFDLGRPGHAYRAELGLLAPDGRFLGLVRSDIAVLPGDGVSDVLDEEWMLMDEEFLKLYGPPGPLPGGPSSLQVREGKRQRKRLAITSPGLFPKRKAKR